jgi:hypothetical protein
MPDFREYHLRSAMKVGRNQSCPCGSGKKYKKCCLGKEKVSSDLLHRRLGEAHDRLAHRLMRCGLKVFGEKALGVALDEFMAWPDEGISDEDLADHRPLFSFIPGLYLTGNMRPIRTTRSWMDLKIQRLPNYMRPIRQTGSTTLRRRSSKPLHVSLSVFTKFRKPVRARATA